MTKTLMADSTLTLDQFVIDRKKITRAIDSVTQIIKNDIVSYANKIENFPQTMVGRRDFVIVNQGLAESAFIPGVRLAEFGPEYKPHGIILLTPEGLFLCPEAFFYSSPHHPDDCQRGTSRAATYLPDWIRREEKPSLYTVYGIEALEKLLQISSGEVHSNPIVPREPVFPFPALVYKLY